MWRVKEIDCVFPEQPFSLLSSPLPFVSLSCPPVLECLPQLGFPSPCLPFLSPPTLILSSSQCTTFSPSLPRCAGQSPPLSPILSCLSLLRVISPPVSSTLSRPLSPWSWAPGRSRLCILHCPLGEDFLVQAERAAFNAADSSVSDTAPADFAESAREGRKRPFQVTADTEADEQRRWNQLHPTDFETHPQTSSSPASLGRSSHFC